MIELKSDFCDGFLSDPGPRVMEGRRRARAVAHDLRNPGIEPGKRGWSDPCVAGGRMCRHGKHRNPTSGISRGKGIQGSGGGTGRLVASVGNEGHPTPPPVFCSGNIRATGVGEVDRRAPGPTTSKNCAPTRAEPPRPNAGRTRCDDRTLFSFPGTEKDSWARGSGMYTQGGGIIRALAPEGPGAGEEGENKRGILFPPARQQEGPYYEFLKRRTYQPRKSGYPTRFRGLPGPTYAGHLFPPPCLRLEGKPRKLLPQRP